MSPLIALIILLVAAALPLAARPAAAQVTLVDAPAGMISQAKKDKKPKSKKPGQKDKKPAKKKAKPAPAPAPPAKPKEPWELPMTATVVRGSTPVCEPSCPEWISLEGEITANSPAVFRKALKLAGKKQLPVIISSPGGSVDAAVEIGRMIRKAKLDVAVGWTRYDGCKPADKACKLPKEQKGVYRGEAYEGRAFCNSACPLILAAGQQRLSGAWSYVGVHQVRTKWVREQVTYRERYKIVKGKKKVVDRKIVSRKTVKSYEKHGLDKTQRKRLSAYLKEMGVGLGMLDDMEKAPPSDMHRLDLTRQEELKLVTSRYTVSLLTRDSICLTGSVAANCVKGEVPPPAPPAPAAVSDEKTALLRVGVAPRDKAMTVAIVRNSSQNCEPLCPQWIAAKGVITAETPKLFKQAFDQMGSLKLPVAFDSPGGDFDAALEIARMIRVRGIDTILAHTAYIRCSPDDTSCSPPGPEKLYKGFPMQGDECAGACVFAAIGGVTITSALREVVLHDPALYRSRGGSSQPAVQLMFHFTSMGVDKDLLRRMHESNKYTNLRLGRQEQVKYLSVYDRTLPTDSVLTPATCKLPKPPAYCVARPDS